MNTKLILDSCNTVEVWVIKSLKKFSKWQWNYFDVQTTNISTNLDGNLGYLDGNKGNAVKELNFKKSILKSLRTLMKL